MIRRSTDGDIQLITQMDHAALAGFLAAHIGNELFTRPTPDVVAATAAHDAGWPIHDDRPTLNADRMPLDVFETPPSLSTKIWSASVERALPLGPYAALLVSIHQLHLSEGVIRRSRESESGGRLLSPREVFDLNKFQHRQIELQEQLRRQIGLRTDIPLLLGLAPSGRGEAEDRLRFDFRLLALCDSLSLELCSGRPLFTTIENILPSPPAEATRIQIDRVNGETLILQPWPFDAATLSTEIPFRPLHHASFADENAFHTAFAAAPVEKFQVELRSAE